MNKIYTPLGIGAILLFCIMITPGHGFGQSEIKTSGRVVVKYAHPEVEAARNQTRRQFKGQLIQAFPKSQIEIWAVPQQQEIEGRQIQRFSELKAYIEANPKILYVEPDYIFELAEQPNDPLLEKQWGISNTGQTGGVPGADVQVLNQWSLTTGQSIVAGIIDTGIDWGHEDLVDNIWQNLAEDADGDGHTIELIDGSWVLDPGDLNDVDEDANGYTDDLVGWDFANNDNNPFDDNGHGTHVAGILAASGNNGKGIAGVSWSSKIMALKAFDNKGAGSVLTILPALEYARLMGADLTNNSWGGPAYSQAIYDEIQLAETADMLTVTAAGNNASNNSASPMYPGSYDLSSIICVAASNHKDSLATFSNFSHTLVDLVAPGQDIYSTAPGNTYVYKSGTSMATPFVSGAICLIWSLERETSASQLKDILLTKSVRKPGLTYQCVSGGRLDILESMRTARAFCETLPDLTVGDKIQGLLSDGDYLWAGTNHGIFRLDKRNCEKTVWTTADGIANNQSFQMDKSANGDIWITTNGGINVWDGTNWSVYKNSNSPLPGQKVQSILIDHADVKWIGMQSTGFVRFDGTDWTVYNVANSDLPANNVREIAEDASGKLWLATNYGLSVFDGVGFTNYNPYNSPLPDEVLYAVTHDSLGNTWIGTNSNGLVKFDGTNWTVFTVANSPLPHNKVQSVKVDQDGYIWLATNGGVARFDGVNQWTVYDASDPLSGIPSDLVVSLLVDNDNNVWAGTSNGLFLFSRDAMVAAFNAQSMPCQNQNVNFQNASIGGKTYKWFIDGNEVSTTTDLNYSFTTAGSHNIQLVAQNLYRTNTLTQEYQVTAIPTLNLGADTVACANSIVLNPDLKNGTFAWKDLLENTLSTKKNFRVDQNGSYILEVNTVCGTIVRDTIVVTLSGDCVWAGDANSDGEVNMLDYLCLGLANGQTGPLRPDATTQWRSEAAPDWAGSFHADHSFGSNVNYKHADCDGNGEVNMDIDAAVVMQNAGATHDRIFMPGGDPITLEVQPSATVMTAADTFVISYEIRIDATEGVSGLAFSLDYDLPLSQTPEISFEGTGLTDVSSAVITYDEANPGSGNNVKARRKTMDIGIVSTTGTNQTFSGKVATMSVIVVLEDIQDINGVLDFVSFSLTGGNLVVIDSLGEAKNIKTNSSKATSTVKINYPEITFPVEWLDFNAQSENEWVELDWSVAQANGQESYTVQRSIDGVRFSNLAQIAGKESGSGAADFQFIDGRPLPGKNFYRILQTDLDGHSSFSKVEWVLVEKPAFDFYLNQNPVSGPFEVQIISGTPTSARLRLVNLLGRVLLERQVDLREGEQKLNFETSNLTPGIYYLELADESYRKVLKVKYQP